MKKKNDNAAINDSDSFFIGASKEALIERIDFYKTACRPDDAFESCYKKGWEEAIKWVESINLKQ